MPREPSLPFRLVPKRPNHTNRSGFARPTITLVVLSIALTAAWCAKADDAATALPKPSVGAAPGSSTTTDADAASAERPTPDNPCPMFAAADLTPNFGDVPPIGALSDPAKIPFGCKWTDGDVQVTAYIHRGTTMMLVPRNDDQITPLEDLGTEAYFNPHRNGPGGSIMALVNGNVVDVGVAHPDFDRRMVETLAAIAIRRVSA